MGKKSATNAVGECPKDEGNLRCEGNKCCEGPSDEGCKQRSSNNEVPPIPYKI